MWRYEDRAAVGRALSAGVDGRKPKERDQTSSLWKETKGIGEQGERELCLLRPFRNAKNHSPAGPEIWLRRPRTAGNMRRALLGCGKEVSEICADMSQGNTSA